MIVDDVMTTDVITVPPSLLLKDAAQLMAERGISGASGGRAGRGGTA